MSAELEKLQSRSSKYTTLILAIIAFILFDVGILMMNFYVAEQIGRDTEIIDIAGRQRTLSQRVTRAITEFELLAVKQLIETADTLDAKNDLSINDEDSLSELEALDNEAYFDANQNILSDEQIELDNFYINKLEGLRAELQDQVAIFDWTLDSFINGGKTTDTSGNSIHLDPAPTELALEKLRETETIWRYFKERIDIIMVRPASDFLNRGEIDGTLNEASEYAQKNNLRILGLMNELTQELTRNAAEKATTLRIIQFAGIAGALIFFLVIMYYIILRFRSADQKLDLAKRETDEIMSNVSGGLFLLDEELVIASQHSAELTRIFNDEFIGGRRFDRMLKELLPKDTLSTAIDYIELLLGDRVNEKLVASLNPMDEVEINLPDDRGGFNTKYLEFNFSRAKRADDSKHLLVAVNDISERIRLAKELEESHEHREAQLELLMNVLHINPQELLIFIDEAELSLNKVNDILRESNTSTDDNRNKISKIFRIAHSLKGDASALDLATFERMAHQFEDELDQIRKMRNPDGNDFIPLVVKLEDLLNHLQGIKEIALRLSDLGTAVSESLHKKPWAEDDYAETDTETDNWAFIQQLSDKVASKEGKEVSIRTSGISDNTIPADYQKLIRDTLIQLTRNSVVHGVEPPEARTASGKASHGTISIKFSQVEDDNFELVFRDDGRGINRDDVLSTALSKGIISDEQAAAIKPNQIYSLIFHPGFSTADGTSVNAGRGVGMDLVREKVKSHGGKLRFKTSVGKFTEFKIILPLYTPETA